MRACERGVSALELLVSLLVIGFTALGLLRVLDGLSRQVDRTIEEAAVIRVREGLNLFFVDPARGNQSRYPDVLDAATLGACRPENPCFAEVLGREGVSQRWKKVGPRTYQSSMPEPHLWIYSERKGSFEKIKI